MPQWTKEQQEAILARNHSILVSAAAGSGKTAVLVERIVSLIREGYRLDRMLIVTFTRAAAAEMKERLRGRLTELIPEDPARYGSALEQMDLTIISTIHVFCKTVLQQDFTLLGIDPTFRIAEEYITKQLKEQALDDAINQLVQEQDPLFLPFAGDFTLREIREMIPTLHTFLMSMPDPFDWLHDHTENMDDEAISLWLDLIRRQTLLACMGARETFRACVEMGREPGAIPSLVKTSEKDLQLAEGICELAETDFRQLSKALEGLKYPTARGTAQSSEEDAWKERWSKLRSKAKDRLKLNTDILSADPEQLRADPENIRQSLRGMERLMQAMYQNYQALKLKQRLVDFNDLEQMTLRVLSDPQTRGEWQRSFDHIFVDECQDVSQVQDAIVQHLHGEDSILFMVGDVKQSIYRFRQADPTLFLSRLRTWSDDPQARERRILLQKNFRSTDTVLEAANQVFRKAMRKDITELDYLPEDELIPGLNTLGDPAVEVQLLRAGDTKKENIAAEASAVARRIGELIREEYPEKDRTYRYSDMVILLSTQSGIARPLSEALGKLGVPVYFDGGGTYYDTAEVTAMKCLLSLLDNPLQDIPLASVLKLPCFGLDENDLARIRLADPVQGHPFWMAWQKCLTQPETEIGARCIKVNETLSDWRFRKENMGLSDLCWYLLRESGYYAWCGADREGDMKQANLRILTEKAAAFESTGDGTLSGFLDLLNLETLSADSSEAHLLGEKDNVVRIMTMHKSKGLQFPIVFLMDMSHKLVRGASGSMPTLHSRLGVLLPCINRELHTRRTGWPSPAFDFQDRLDVLAERCRLLYVAMTRAQRHLILTGTVADEGTPASWTLPDGSWRVWQAASMLDWVMQALCDAGVRPDLPESAVGPWHMRWVEGAPAELPGETADTEQEMFRMSAEGMSSMPSRWVRSERPAYIPLKTSVTGLSAQLHQQLTLPEEETEETPADKRQPLRMPEPPRVPAFLQEKQLTAALRGTLMHRFLGLARLEEMQGDPLRGVQKEIRRMDDAGIYQSDELQALNPWKLAAWFRSDLGQRMLRSPEIHREWGFNLCLDTDRGTLLQGIIDLVFLEGDQWILVDYKTDHIEDPEAFAAHHSFQLNWYAEALERITGRKVAQCWLWSIQLEQAFPVSRETDPTAIPDITGGTI